MKELRLSMIVGGTIPRTRLLDGIKLRTRSRQ